MRKIVLLFVLSLAILSCTVTEKPEFVKVNSIEIIDSSVDSFTLLAKLQFENKNSVGGTLQAKNIHIFIDSLDVASINSKPFNVPKKSKFELPLEVKIPFSKIYNNNKKYILSNILNTIISKKVNINYVGDIRYKLGNFHYDYPINYNHELELIK